MGIRFFIFVILLTIVIIAAITFTRNVIERIVNKYENKEKEKTNDNKK